MFGKLGVAVDNNDLSEQQRIFHTLKGSSGNLGMMRLHLMCNRLETQVKDAAAAVSNEQLEMLESLREISCNECRDRLAGSV